MDIAIGLPATIPGTSGSLVLDWARRADAGPFSSLGILDRLVYPNYETMITLAAAAAVTDRIRVMSTILIAPLRRGGVLAKQAATLDALSGGRLTLGIGVGAREDDFRAAPRFLPRPRQKVRGAARAHEARLVRPTGERRGRTDGTTAGTTGRSGAVDRRLLSNRDTQGGPMGRRIHQRRNTGSRAGTPDVRRRGRVVESRRKGRQAAARWMHLLRPRSER